MAIENIQFNDIWNVKFENEKLTSFKFGLLDWILSWLYVFIKYNIFFFVKIILQHSFKVKLRSEDSKIFN